ncbi:hypothetical protein A3C87_03475 [Candidatus Kaiserbacteria bacterium RIFCSPHIGHO2_02_FULL_49_34]|uniref:Sortase n=1 Tax=Candidatus Kaiserbacteria bacterium RIFCSPHIGHO2_02_FULL_49_34 TaxID=1798491 RepID=A0A1F6DIE7_9BACT|nr:MAG: hypothetical protein A3C87_03475 [Candidatus Kaiserbacteria bacterium RIFCSPHIGHO2_02_FULL_49_34]
MAAMYGVLSATNFIPNERPLSYVVEESNESVIDESTVNEVIPRVATNVALAGDATPNQIIIDKFKKTLTVNNPTTSDIATLDNSLLTGVARYPSSATMNDDGTMLIFGHSSHLAVVKNMNFRAFNDIEDLLWGDTIRVRSDDYEYVYRVDRVYQLKATADSIPMEQGIKKLVLVTCNTFGAKEDRYIVEASFVDAIKLN